ncbi:MAG: transglycosylase domain-containing protein, partial [bacterium]|nr:transglycosylase domain-containing protein [bacterium]
MESPKKRRYYQKWLGEVSQQFWLIKKRPWVTMIVRLFLIGCGVALLGGISFAGYLYYYTGNLTDDLGIPLDFSKIERGDFKNASHVYDSEGKEIIGRFFYEVRDPINVDAIPGLLAKGFIAAEDKNFYASFHRGIDPLAIVRAYIFNKAREWRIASSRSKSGASGIPQQVARLAYAGEVESFRNRAHSYTRKLVEAQVAIQLVKRYPKEKIMATFLNQIYFGHGVNGIAEARRYYFGRDLKDGELSLREIAILVSLNKSPSIYCPIFHVPNHPKHTAEVAEYNEAAIAGQRARIILARERYNWVLERMYDEKYISQADFEEARFKKEEPLELAILKVTKLKDARFGYGNRVVKEMLLGQGYTDEEITLSRGLWIRTGFNKNIQQIVTEEVNKQLLAVNEELPEGAPRIEGSFVVIENKTGNVVAFSGGHDFFETQYNRALALRSPGSAFKPIVFAAAFEFGGKTFEDKICNCPFSMRGANGKRWAPKNFREDNPVPLGYRPLPEILIRSVNLGTLNLARGIGIDPIVEIAHRLGVWGERGIFKDSDGKIWFKTLNADSNRNVGLESLLPTAIGGSDVSLLELVNAYSVFARGGIYMKPRMILEIKDR